MEKLLKRFKEPSTFAGLAAILFGVGEVFKVNELAPIADTVAQAGQAAAGGDFTLSIGAIVAGVLAVLTGEKGGK